MARERAAKRAEDYEVGDGRRQARHRAGLGALLIAVLFGALTLVDRSDESGTPELPGAPSGAGEAALVPPREPVVAAAVSVPAKDPAPAAEGPAQTGPEATSAVRGPDAPPAGTGAEVRPGEQNGQAPEPNADPATADSPMAAEIPPGQGVLVQLGVFGSTANAQRLYEELQRRGVPAHLETRVVAGPFPDRRSAEQARAELARSGLAKGLIVRPN